MKEKSSVILGTILAFGGIALLASCGGGDTDGGTASGDAGVGTPYVSDGASGSKMTIELEGSDTIPTAGRVPFIITATDPNGLPLSYVRINCESEHGISIIEPSRGGVAFETTNAQGKFSGVFGGLSEGSYMVECRAPQGYNLVARKHYKVVGAIPEGFNGFPGAAGGNLGGGTIVEPPLADSDNIVTVTEITFESAREDGGRVGNIDNFFDLDCDNDGNNTIVTPTTPLGTFDPEVFGPDTYTLALNNLNEGRIYVQSIQYDIDLGTTKVSSIDQKGGLVVEGGASINLNGVFTQPNPQTGTGTADKYFSGTNIPTPSGTYNVTFTITYINALGEVGTIEQSAAILIFNVNGC